ncbi:hypothetical protein BU23DRAFT_535132 [Bimuria novae-zelandiae CBS 107.79]|uniref:Transcription factor TFIIIB component B'' Myb domain-containing protein n=1 Tax=Bimuria novae-zelandiae CBS 107.79 TaxID=1447943 RepID=A0A6A5VG05_9PLEO|nr:hypothetical protein BU23DRAFT_535132 [Bimuria novae-zelandiae CBS 107.79]
MAMSGEGEPKAAPKAPAITSAFINKGAKTFAPKKAIRRRPAAATAPKAPIPPTSTPQALQPDTAPVVEQATPQPDATPAVEQQTPPQLPTPTATQEPVQQDHTAPELPTATASPSTTSPAVEPSPTPVLTTEEAVSLEPPAPLTVASSLIKDASGPSPERQGTVTPQDGEPQQAEQENVPAAQQEAALDAPVEDAGPETNQITATVAEHTTADAAEAVADAVQPAETASHTTDAPSSAPVLTTATLTDTAPVPAQNNPSADSVIATQPATRRARGAPTWNAVNATIDNAAGPATTPKPRKPSGRRRAKPVTLRNMEEEEEETAAEAPEGEDAEEDFVPPRAKRPSAKARGKRKAAEASTGEAGGDTQPPAKKKRQSRRTSAKNTIPTEDGQNVEPGPATGTEQVLENGQSIEDGPNGESSATAVRPKPSRKRKRQTTSQADDAIEGEQQPKRKTRPPRAPTPSDAEDEEIDPDEVFMGDLARRNIRFGRLSQREKKMRTIDWEEVKQRQKNKEAEQMKSREITERILREQQEKEDALRTQQEQANYELRDGKMHIAEGSGQVDHERIVEEMLTEVVEEDDYTNRINARSFMRDNKRHPEEFLLPGQGKRWNVKSTADFYDALRMFGTDFGMMTSLFEGVSRRSLKLKFTREEKKNPEAIKEILRQESTRLKDWDEFLRASGKKNEEYNRVEEIKRKFEDEERKHREEIEEARKEYEEIKRQKEIAGVVDDEEEGAGNEGKKKKKGKKGKEKQVTFQQDEEGVEILEVGENDGWGEH